MTTDKRTESQFDDHSCPNCPDTSDYDKAISEGGFGSRYAQAAKDYEVATHKFDVAADKWLNS